MQRVKCDMSVLSACGNTRLSAMFERVHVSLPFTRSRCYSGSATNIVSFKQNCFVYLQVLAASHISFLIPAAALFRGPCRVRWLGWGRLLSALLRQASSLRLYQFLCARKGMHVSNSSSLIDQCDRSSL